MRERLTMRTLLLVGLLSFHATTGAAGDTKMNFHGTLIVPPPCTINDGNRVDVDFGERVGINKVDGSNYRQGVNYQITCERGSSDAWVMTLTLNGSPTGFDQHALKTDRDNLGIRVYQNDVPFTPGTSLKIALGNPPQLEAVPVKKIGTTLSVGKFEAWATLRADYQ
ncbi:fimbrial protein [Serratia fonticola]|uniref:fimbrial protein n=1 Tax=Serratia fonticola TaxID=47917 RepID=UPI0021773BCF|nr:fimbrial protein [Serratia fonticola]CAI2001699.1 Minor fimbrial protein prsF precursor [Serratia fonticola]CAI2019414.1 Minor fimbrial protein prsF precursor [Serratia fonticola]